MTRTTVALLPCVLVAVACVPEATGYDPEMPTKITCGCHDRVTCYEGASQLASSQGENAATGEQLLYFSQCACFQGSMAGCNTLSHFAKDFVAACERGVEVKDSCTIAGLVYLHGVAVPERSGRSFDADAAAAKAHFARACAAGSAPACRQAH